MLRVVKKQERDTPVQQDLKDNMVVDTEIEDNENDEVVKDAENDTDLIFHLSTNRFVQFQRGIVYDKNITKMSEIAVYVMLCESRYKQTYSAKISVATLADKARCDARTVRNAIKVLKENGYIEDIVEGGGKKKPNIYTLTKETVVCEMQPKAAILTKGRMEDALRHRESLISQGIISADDKDVYFRWNKKAEKNFRLMDSEGHMEWEDNFYSSAPTSTKKDTVTEIEKPQEDKPIEPPKRTKRTPSLADKVKAQRKDTMRGIYVDNDGKNYKFESLAGKVFIPVGADVNCDENESIAEVVAKIHSGGQFKGIVYNEIRVRKIVEYLKQLGDDLSAFQPLQIRKGGDVPYDMSRYV